MNNPRVKSQGSNQYIAKYYRRNVYGNILLYPANEVAATLVSLSGKQTISPFLQKATRNLGYEWVEVLEGQKE